MFTLEFNLKDSYKENIYTSERGYGFFAPEMAENISGIDHEQALKSGGWNRRQFYEEVDEKDRQVLIIKTSVPEFGTYKVSVLFTAREKSIENLILFSSRRAMIERGINIPTGSTHKVVYHTAVTPYIPALSSKRCNDRDIFISLTGKGICQNTGNDYADVDISNIDISVNIEKETVPVIWVGGDSTVTDQNAGIPYYPFGSFSGWAQTLPRYIRGAAVCNLSHSGLTSTCFRDDGHYAIIEEMMHPGDLLILQFGHNDQKRRNLKAFDGYADNLRRYVKETRSKGADVILCSPISRIPLSLTDSEAEVLSMDKHYSLLSDYARAVEAVAKELDAVFVDLHDLTFKKWLEYGDKAKDFFMPGDVTHTNEYGSLLISGMFINEIRSTTKGQRTLVGYGDNDLEISFAAPDSDTKTIPPQEPEPDIFAIDPPYVDIEGFEDMDELKKAFKYCLLDPCVMYLHPYEVMPRSQVLMVLFKAFRIAGTRPYMGKFSDLRTDEWDSGYVETMIKENLIDPETIRGQDGKLFFRPDDALTYDELDSFLMRFYEPDPGKRNIPVDECVRRARESSLDKRETITPGQLIKRGEVYTTLARFIDLTDSIKTRSISFDA